MVVDETPELSADPNKRKALTREQQEAIKSPPRRALTLVEFLHRQKIIGFEEYAAAGRLRNLHFTQEAPSEGISSYGLGTGGIDPTRKADRKAKRMTGIDIDVDGVISRGPSKANRVARWRYQDALLAMCGCITEENGDRVVDPQTKQLMLRAIIDTEDMVTQQEIGSARFGYRSNKQISAVGAAFVIECLRKLALHFGMRKGEILR